MRTTTRKAYANKSVLPPNLLISIRNEMESEIAFEILSADRPSRSAISSFSMSPWIDLKEPNRGSLGRPDRTTALETYARFQAFERNSPAIRCHNFSIALGELSETSDEEITAYCEDFGDEVFFKIGLAKLEKSTQWQKRILDLVKSASSPSQWILVHYADAEKANAPTWDEILQVSHLAGCEYILVDTWQKDGRSLLDILSRETLKHMAAHAHAMGLQIAMAGSLRLTDLDALLEVGPRWIGFRSDLCESRKRESSLNPNRLDAVLEMFHSIHAEPTAMTPIGLEARTLEQNVIR